MATIFTISLSLLFLAVPFAVFSQSATVLDVQVSSSADDAYHDPDSWPSYSHTDAGSGVYAGNPGSTGGVATVGGFRWTGLNIPIGSTITNAYIELNQKGWGYQIPTTLSFENSASPASFSSVSSPYHRWQNKTLFTLGWTWPKVTPGTWIRTPSIASGIQELADRYGALNSVVLLEDGSGVPSGQYHNWESYDGNSLLTARLHIEYLSGVDTTPPIRSNGQPTGIFAAGTTQATLSLTTNENATCRYATVAGVTYVSSTNVFSTTGFTAHSVTVTGLVDGTAYNFYVKCEDVAGNANTNDFLISFAVDVPDTAVPVRSNGQPAGDLSSGTTQTTLSLTTNENAACRYSQTAGTAYEAMLNTFTTTGFAAHSTSAAGLTDDTSYTFYVKCQDGAGNANPDDYSISFSVLPDTAAPVRSNGQPTGTLPSGTTQATLSLTSNENATCRYETVAGVAYASSTNAFYTTGGISHSALVAGLTDDTAYSYYVRCQDALGNANIDDFPISFSIAPPGPIVVNAQIAGNSDDAYQDPDGWPGYSHTDAGNGVYAGNPGGAGGLATVGGFRWANVNIPAGATIVTAYVDLNQGGWGYTIPTTLSFENSQNSATFSSASGPYSRWANRTVFELPWIWPKQTPGIWIRTPSLVSGIQELVSQYGGVSNITLLENGAGVASGQYHGWAGFEQNPSLGAKLHIEYTIGSQGPDTFPPVISNGQPSGTLPAGTTQTVLSVATSENATCKFGITAGVSYSLIVNTFTTTGGTSHSTLVSGLQGGTSYNYYVRCQDIAGNATTSDTVISFNVAVPGGDTIPSVISNGQPAGTLPAGTASTTISVATDENSTCKFDTISGIVYSLMANTFGTTGAISHSSLVPSLQDGTAYSYYVKCQDAAGNANISDFVISFAVASPTPPDQQAPAITGIRSFPSITSAVIEWKTNEPATSQVFYGTTSALGSQTTIDSKLVTSHAVFVNGLSAQTNYNFQVRSKDAAGNEATSPSSPSVFSTVSSAVIPQGAFPPGWPAKVDLAVGESYVHTLGNGTTRTLTLLSYAVLTPMQEIEATIRVSNGAIAEIHTLRVAHAGVPVSLNGLRVYGYAWKEADDSGFELVGFQGNFPLQAGKDVGFAVSDAASPMFPNLSSYAYPFDGPFHGGAFMQTWLERSAPVAHSGYDVGGVGDEFIRAITDGYLFANLDPDPASEGMIWLMRTNTNQFDQNQACWVWTHVKGGSIVSPAGTFVTKGTPLARITGGDNPLNVHTHMGSCNSFDFGTWLFSREVWNNEHQDDFPAPRHWLTLGSYLEPMSMIHIAPNETGDIASTIIPRKGDVVDIQAWKFSDNLVQSVVRMGDIVAPRPFSGSVYDGGFVTNEAERIGYAAVSIYSFADHTTDNVVHLKWSMNDKAVVWLNGKNLLNTSQARYATYAVGSEPPLVMDAYDIPLQLKKGWNTLIAKTNQGTRPGGSWLFSAKIGDANGNQLPDLRFSARSINMRVTASDATSVSLAWSAPDFHGTFVDTYKFDVSEDASFSGLIISDLDLGKVTSLTVTGLQPGRLYYFRVKPFNRSELGGSAYWEHHDVVSRGTELVPSRVPPAGLLPAQVPQFVLFGSDDNWMAEGVDWFVNNLYVGKTNPVGASSSATYDGIAAKGTFYAMGELEGYGMWIRDALRNAWLAGHEIGNHGYLDADSGLTSDGWLASITKTNDYLTRNLGGDGVLVQAPGGGMTPRLGVGIPASEIVGYRTPHDGYNDALFPILQALGFTYHASSATGHPSQSADGTDQHWAGTLGQGIPYANPIAGTNPIPNTPGLWEIPQNFMWLPASMGGGVILYCDKDWFWAFRNDDSQTQANKIEGMLKYNLDLHLQGNRAPFHLCLHSQEWGIPSWQTDPAVIAKIQARQTALNNFLIYALSKPEVRVVPQIDLIKWMRNPVPL